MADVTRLEAHFVIPPPLVSHSNHNKSILDILGPTEIISGYLRNIFSRLRFGPLEYISGIFTKKMPDFVNYSGGAEEAMQRGNGTLKCANVLLV